MRSGPNGELSTLDSIITENTCMKKLKQRIWDAAQTNSPAIIYGEIGTGKNLRQRRFIAKARAQTARL